jgi:hypothetical protein
MPDCKPVAVVNGQTITRATFDFYVQAATGQPSASLNAEQKQQALERLDPAAAGRQQRPRRTACRRVKPPRPSNCRVSMRYSVPATESYLKDKTPTDQE